jgi:hypothetical protein
LVATLLLTPALAQAESAVGCPIVPVPKAYREIGALPRNAGGKVLKKDLRSLPT